jgi:toxin ParE1/3/4
MQATFAERLVTREVTFRPAAENDLAALYAYIRDARCEPSVAIGFIRRIRALCERLSEFAERGTRRDDLRPGLRIVTFERRVVIAFETTEGAVRVARIFYGGRDYEALMRETGEPLP